MTAVAHPATDGTDDARSSESVWDGAAVDESLAEQAEGGETFDLVPGSAVAESLAEGGVPAAAENARYDESTLVVEAVDALVEDAPLESVRPERETEASEDLADATHESGSFEEAVSEAAAEGEVVADVREREGSRPADPPNRAEPAASPSASFAFNLEALASKWTARADSEAHHVDASMPTSPVDGVTVDSDGASREDLDATSGSGMHSDPVRSETDDEDPPT